MIFFINYVIIILVIGNKNLLFMKKNVEEGMVYMIVVVGNKDY